MKLLPYYISQGWNCRFLTFFLSNKTLLKEEKKGGGGGGGGMPSITEDMKLENTSIKKMNN